MSPLDSISQRSTRPNSAHISAAVGAFKYSTMIIRDPGRLSRARIRVPFPAQDPATSDALLESTIMPPSTGPRFAFMSNFPRDVPRRFGLFTRRAGDGGECITGRFSRPCKFIRAPPSPSSRKVAERKRARVTALRDEQFRARRDARRYLSRPPPVAARNARAVDRAIDKFGRSRPIRLVPPRRRGLVAARFRSRRPTLAGGSPAHRVTWFTEIREHEISSATRSAQGRVVVVRDPPLRVLLARCLLCWLVDALPTAIFRATRPPRRSEGHLSALARWSASGSLPRCVYFRRRRHSRRIKLALVYSFVIAAIPSRLSRGLSSRRPSSAVRARN